jgi:hypothetical protein
VLLPAVLRIHRGQRRVDPAGGQRGVRVVARTLAQGKDFDALLGQLDRGPQAATAGSDHQDGGCDLLLGHRH